MKFDSEREMEDMIYNYYFDTGKVIIDDHSPHHLKRQFSLGDYGIIDLVSFVMEPEGNPSGGDRSVCAKIYELKNGPITMDAIAQISRYHTGMVEAFRSIEGFELVGVDLALVGLSIDSCCHVMQSAGIEYYQAVFDVENGLDFIDHSAGWAINGASTGSALTNLLNVSEVEEV